MTGARRRRATNNQAPAKVGESSWWKTVGRLQPRVLRGPATRDFRLFAASHAIFMLAICILRVAQDALVLALSNESAAALGVTVALQSLPNAGLPMWGGRLGDRYSKRLLLIVTQVGICVNALVVEYLVIFSSVKLWHVYAAALLTGALTAIDAPIRQAFIADLVSDQDVGHAVTLNLTLNSVAAIAGPAVASMLISTSELGWLFIGTAVLTVAVMAVMVAIKRPAMAPDKTTEHGDDGRGGLAYVWRRPDLRSLMLVVFVASTLAMIFPISLASLAYHALTGGAETYGVLCTVLGVGWLAGTVAAARKRGCPSMGMVIMTACAFGAAEFIDGLMPDFLTIALLLFLTTALCGAFRKFVLTRLHLTVERAFQSRVMGVYFWCALGGWPLGAALLGWLADNAGPRSPLIAGGAATAVAALAVAYLWRRTLRTDAVP